MNAANFVTILRVLSIPVFIAVYYSGLEWSHAIACFIFTLACISDWLDGYLARKLDQSSKFGAFLDPVADKLLVTVTLIMLAANYTSLWFVIPACFMVAREVLVTALREWMADNNQRDTVKVGFVGKVKTTFQMIAIGFLLATSPEGPEWFVGLAYVLTYIATFLTFWSMMIYLKSAWPALTSELK